MERYEIIDKETLWEGRYLRCVRLSYHDSQGVLRHWESVERVHCDGVVAVVPVTDEGEILLIRQFRPAVNGMVIEFPAGLNDRGEDIEDAAKRELREETGFESEEIKFLARGPLSSGASNEVLTVFLARGLRFRGIDGRDETEEIEVLKVRIEGASELLAQHEREGDLIDLKIFGLIELARRQIG